MDGLLWFLKEMVIGSGAAGEESEGGRGGVLPAPGAGSGRARRRRGGEGVRAPSGLALTGGEAATGETAISGDESSLSIGSASVGSWR